MSSRSNTLTPSPSNLSYTLTSTHTHHQHISPYRHLANYIQAGSGNPTVKKKTFNISLTDSYRPVSLLPFIAKTLELVVFNQLSSFLSNHNLLDNNQSGFRRGHSKLRRRYSQSLKPCGLQKLIPNPRFSFCWIYLLLLTWLTSEKHQNNLNPIKDFVVCSAECSAVHP